MPPTMFKRKESIVKGVRRLATGHLDQLIRDLTATDKPQIANAHREALRLQALLLLVRRPLGGEVFSRENRVVNRALRHLAPSPSSAQIKTVKKLAQASPVLDGATVVDTLNPVPPSLAKKKRPRKGPDPKMLRLVADLAEVRMRSRYWHLPDGGFELFKPGLRQAYQSSSRPADAAEPPEALAAALGTLGRQLQLFERMWPALLVPYRKAIRSAERTAHQLATLTSLHPAVETHAELLGRLDTQAAELQTQLAQEQRRLFAETPTAWLKRMNAYWGAWRA